MQRNPVIENTVTNPTLERIESQIEWYQYKSIKSRKIYKTMKFLQIIMAILIPTIVHIDLPIIKWIISVLGALIALFESIQYMNQYEAIWISHRTIAQLLRREKFLFLSAAGPYAELDESGRLKHLAVSVEEIISIE